MAEYPLTAKGKGNSEFISFRNDLPIAHGPPGVEDRFAALGGGSFQSVWEGEKGIRPHHAVG